MPIVIAQISSFHEMLSMMNEIHIRALVYLLRLQMSDGYIIFWLSQMSYLHVFS